MLVKRNAVHYFALSSHLCFLVPFLLMVPHCIHFQAFPTSFTKPDELNDTIYSSLFHPLAVHFNNQAMALRVAVPVRLGFLDADLISKTRG